MKDPKSYRSNGIGASVKRLEDDRYLSGRGKFVGDIRLPGMLEIAFVRSPLAHANIKNIHKPEGFEESVFVCEDLISVRGIKADSGLPGFKSSVQPILASKKVRHVGEPVVACVAENRAAAEDIADSIHIEFEELPAIHDMKTAMDAGNPLIHESWDKNCFLETNVETNFDEAIISASSIVKRTFQTARQCMAPMEGRAVVAQWDNQLSQLTVHSATQMPHIVRTGLSECLGLEEGKIRVVAPDVGGGFGYKGILLAEEVFAGWLAMKTGRPVRWLEDRREHLTSGANCREHHYEVVGYADSTGQLLAVSCEAIVDSGAYSIYPFSACLEAAQVASILPGPYKMLGYKCKTYSVATNKPPILPYRGVARTGVCFAMELIMDALARDLDMSPKDIRIKNLVKKHEMPFINITNKHFDSGDYCEAVERASTAIDFDKLRVRKQNCNANEKLGFGLSIFCEQGAHGTSVYRGYGIPMVPGFEQSNLRLTPDGGLEVRVGVQSHGQGLETTLAQIASQELSIEESKIKVVHGDTAYTPYSTGTWGSRCIVMAGGAVSAASEVLAKRIKKIAAHLLQASPEEIILKDGKAQGKNNEIAISDIAHAWYRQPHLLPEDVDPRGLEVTEGYKTVRDTGTFSYACHAVIVSVDLELGNVKILDYVVVEDAGTMINPMVVDGQVLGGVAQGVGTALFEEMPFDTAGQPMASTLADYHLPVASDLPPIQIIHMETPSPISRYGQKGIGESGAIGPPAAIANAVNDALAPLGVEINQIPITPSRVLKALSSAKMGLNS